MGEKLKIIYEPKGAAREYAELALNLYNGCTHGCVYCYNNGRYSARGEFFRSSKPKMDITEKLAKDCRRLVEQYGDSCPEVLLSFIGDVYQPSEKTLGYTRMVIRTLISHRIPFTVLTKSALVKRDFDLLVPYRDRFRLGMTIITADQSKALAWEPGASLLHDRTNVLLKAKQAGIKTWVSLEPVMSAASAVEAIRQFHRFVDVWHIGKLNHMKPPEPVDWIEAMRDIMIALERNRCEYKFKKSFTEL